MKNKSILIIESDYYSEISYNLFTSAKEVNLFSFTHDKSLEGVRCLILDHTHNNRIVTDNIRTKVITVR